MKIKEAIGLLGTIFFFIFLGSLQCVSQSAASRQEQIESHSHQAQKFLNEKRPDLAIPEFRAILALDRDNVDALGNLGVLLFFQGDYAGAISPLRAALKLQPELWKIQMLLGMAEKRTGDTSGALADLERAFSKTREEKIKTEAGMELIEMYTSAGDLDKGATVVDELDDLYPTNPQVLYSSYRIHSDLAEQAMLSLALVAPASAIMHRVMAHELELHEHSAGAIEQYRLALKLNPNLPGVHIELAELLNSSSNPALHAQAKSEYEAALTLNPFDEKAERRLGELAAQAGDLKTATDDYSRALKLEPNDSEAMTDYAKVLISLNQPQKAIALLERSLELDPTSAVAHYRLSVLYRQMGKPAEAKQELQKFQTYNQESEKLRKLFETMSVQAQEAERSNGHSVIGPHFSPVY
jgi:tetratricopeptide (TPR) repeat protein